MGGEIAFLESGIASIVADGTNPIEIGMIRRGDRSG
jgi:hypothetical protein